MREIVLDTETTGFKPEEGHRIVEIGCVELINHLPTGERRQWYINPERPMPAEAFAVHGLSDEFLAKQPVFGEVVGAFLDFVAADPLIIHNAAFDLSFLNAELRRLSLPAIAPTRAVDTVLVARRRFPGAPASLDALCKRFEIDNSNRTLHGALLDSQLLAECYLELLGGRQTDLMLATRGPESGTQLRAARPPRPPRIHEPSTDEQAAHRALLERLKKPVWLN
ncbi:MAG: DNA polymerase III subunit epsilon [Azospirillum sp.]|nr:DNA polymerase III subunit epsilon [Azospirillum sp.]